MEQEQIDKFPFLAQMLDYLGQIQTTPRLDNFKTDVQNLLGIIPEHHDKLVSQITKIDQAQNILNQVVVDINSFANQIKTEYNDIFNHLNTKAWFHENLEISKRVREHWVVFDGHYNELLALVSSIDRIWRFPVACINAQHKEVIDALVSADLVYMMDTDPLILENNFKQTELSMQHKIKYHKISEFYNINFEASELLTIGTYGVPINQMALVVIMNVFERFTADMLEESLIQLKKLLRPGGMIFFNVLDAEKDTIAKCMIEKSTSGMTKTKMQDICRATDYTLKYWKTVVAHNGICVVLQAPGQLNSIKSQPSTAYRKKS